MMKIDPKKIFLRASEIIHSNTGTDVYMMSIENGEYYGANEIGARIWTLLEEPIRVDQIYHHLLQEYQIDEATCKKETQDFLVSLYEKNLIQEQ